MIPFLKQVAEHYLSLPGVGSYCFIFPNRRSLVFFRKYLADTLSEHFAAVHCDRHLVKPIIAPQMITINDFFYKSAGVSAIDRVNQLIELYGCYKKLNPKAESLDEFIFWGDVILSDFNDVDKYLVDPQRLFTNVSDFKSLQDTFSYLTDLQRQAIESFVSHFNDRNGRLTVDIDSESPDVKGKFLQVWNILYPLYRDFNISLKERGLSYEGMVYRDLAERVKKESVVDVFNDGEGTEKYVFVGLNTLNECEKTVLRKMRDSGLAEFCWDFSSDMIRDPHNKASFFMAANVREFPGSFQIDPDGLKMPQINVIDVPSSVGMAKQIPWILKDHADLNTDWAIVLPDENLLIPVLNTVPERINDINVTMGYPMSGSGFYALMKEISAMQMHIRIVDGKPLFYYRQVWSILSNGVLRKVIGDAAGMVNAVKTSAKYYVPQSDLSGNPVLDVIFRNVIVDLKSDDSDQIHRFEQYQLDVIQAIAPKLKEHPDMALEMDFAQKYFQGINLLMGKDLDIRPLTYVNLLDQAIGAEAVPFNGEPLKGLQIMGTLETRALDFSNLVILSANEGMFPRRSVASSFVPPELRKGFGLPTYEYQDAMWAYYFYRMIQRAENVWMLVDTRTEGVKVGEESRYIKQLEYHFGVPVKRFRVGAEVKLVSSSEAIPKTMKDVQIIRNGSFSASSLQNYLDCPARFYYHSVVGLKQENEVTESMDPGMLGNVFHNTMYALYLGEKAMRPDFSMERGDVAKNLPDPLKAITKDYILSWIRRKELIRAKIDSLIGKELNSFEVSGRNLVLEDVILHYVLKTLERDLEHMKECGSDHFDVYGLEMCQEWNHDGFRFVGYIDRVDSFREGQVRIVDYKTGNVKKEDIIINDENASKVADLLFGKDNGKRPKIALQLFLYDMFVQDSPYVKGKEVVNTLYPEASLFTSNAVDVAQSKEFVRIVKERLDGLLREITDVDVPFSRTDQTRTCQWCDFKNICGR